MKILMVNKFLYPRGGSESYMLKLGKAYEMQGHEVQYFGMFDEKNTVTNCADMYTSNMDFHSTGVARFLYPFKILYSIEAKRKIGKVLDSFKPDIVHMNNINFQLTPSIIYAVKKRGIPLVQTVHDYQMICPNHLLYSFKENKPCVRCINGSKLSCAKHSCIHDSKIKSILGTIESWLYSALKTYKKVDLYICPSAFLENKLLTANKLYAGKTFTIHNFIDKAEAVDTDENIAPYILYVGRLSKEKGVELLADGAKLLPEYKFKVAGTGPDGDALSNIENVELLGFVSGGALSKLMAEASVLIAPSVCFENCPLSILEANALGTPVITMNSGGMAELVSDGVTGTLVSEPNAACIAEKIKLTLENKEYYAKLKENCVKTKDSILTVDEYSKILLEKYEKLIDGRQVL
ncbi:MAG: glycosyltransferase [Clostridia bacterium]|nr:glycosyltransferase [Clostridia bacterium]